MNTNCPRPPLSRSSSVSLCTLATNTVPIQHAFSQMEGTVHNTCNIGLQQRISANTRENESKGGHDSADEEEEETEEEAEKAEAE